MKEFAENAKDAALVAASELAETAKAGLAGAKAGLAEARKVFSETKNNK